MDNKNIIYILLGGIVLGVVYGFFRSPKPRITPYNQLNQIEYIGELHLVNYTSEELLVVYKNEEASMKAQGLEKELQSIDSLILKEKETNNLDSDLKKLNQKRNRVLTDFEKLDAKYRQFMAFIPVSISAFTDLANVDIKNEERQIQIPPSSLSKPNVKIDPDNKTFNLSRRIDFLNFKIGDEQFQTNLLKAIQKLEARVVEKARKKGITADCDALAVAYIKNLVKGMPGDQEYSISLNSE